MSRTKLTNYESEFSIFLKGLKAERPHLEQQQQEGRLRLWDKEPISLDEQQRIKESRIAQKAYVYLTNYDTTKKD